MFHIFYSRIFFFEKEKEPKRKSLLLFHKSKLILELFFRKEKFTKETCSFLSLKERKEPKERNKNFSLEKKSSIKRK